ncbi:MAG: DNA topoisomerase I, partial [Firmicutes bacterium HGW-Firmicutes-13]
AGFLIIYDDLEQDEREKDSVLPELREDQELKLFSLKPQQHFTQPSPRYTEASLVKTLEEKGIGRPSTYAPIIDTIQSRFYVVREDKNFVPTELGEIVVNLMKEFFPDIINIEFTASMEEKLDLIEDGKSKWIEVIDKFYQPFHKSLQHAEKEMEEVDIQDQMSDEICEKCGRQMVYKFGRFGKFLACPGFPECRNTKPIFKETGIKCPFCSGEIVERKTKKGRKFFGCSSYPECEFISWYRPVDQKCPECGSILVEKRGRHKVTLECLGKDCTYQSQKNRRKQKSK